MYQAMFKTLILCSFLPVVVFCVKCDQEPDGNYDVGCRYFVKCLKGNKTEVFCKTGQALNTKKFVCERSDKVPRPCGTSGGYKPKDCSSLKDGHYADTEFNCRYFYVCSNGFNLGASPCGITTVYNEEVGACDHPRNTKPPCGTYKQSEDDYDNN